MQNIKLLLGAVLSLVIGTILVVLAGVLTLVGLQAFLVFMIYLYSVEEWK